MRIAIRAEGRFVNAYIADLTTMDDAKLIASISRACCDADPEVFEAFKRAAELACAAIIKSVADVEAVDFDTRPAPERERAGDA